jgi:hypothetical protein
VFSAPSVCVSRCLSQIFTTHPAHAVCCARPPHISPVEPVCETLGSSNPGGFVLWQPLCRATQPVCVQVTDLDQHSPHPSGGIPMYDSGCCWPSHSVQQGTSTGAQHVHNDAWHSSIKVLTLSREWCAARQLQASELLPIACCNRPLVARLWTIVGWRQLPQHCVAVKFDTTV